MSWRCRSLDKAPLPPCQPFQDQNPVTATPPPVMAYHHPPLPASSTHNRKTVDNPNGPPHNPPPTTNRPHPMNHAHTTRRAPPRHQLPIFRKGIRDFHAQTWTEQRDSASALAYEQGRLLAAAGCTNMTSWERFSRKALGDHNGHALCRQPPLPDLQLAPMAHKPQLFPRKRPRIASAATGHHLSATPSIDQLLADL